MRKIFVTGIGTGVGKTIVSAILTETLEADYWKPIQTGSLDGTDSETVKKLLSNKKSVIHRETYCLQKPVSPHEAAAEEGITISVRKIIPPFSSNILVIEGAGGILVPLNDQETMLDLIKVLDAEVIFVVRHYLGSINHTLLSGKALLDSGVKVSGIIYSGRANLASEKAIENFLSIPVLARIDEEVVFTPVLVSQYANKLKPCILQAPQIMVL